MAEPHSLAAAMPVDLEENKSDSEWEYEYAEGTNETELQPESQPHRKRRRDYDASSASYDQNAGPPRLVVPKETKQPKQPRPRSSLNDLQYLDFTSSNPILKRGDQVYSCHWTAPYGTDVLLSRKGASSYTDASYQPSHTGAKHSILIAQQLRLIAQPVELSRKPTAAIPQPQPQPQPHISTHYAPQNLNPYPSLSLNPPNSLLQPLELGLELGSRIRKPTQKALDTWPSSTFTSTSTSINTDIPKNLHPSITKSIRLSRAHALKQSSKDHATILNSQEPSSNTNVKTTETEKPTTNAKPTKATGRKQQADFLISLARLKAAQGHTEVVRVITDEDLSRMQDRSGMLARSENAVLSGYSGARDGSTGVRKRGHEEASAAAAAAVDSKRRKPPHPYPHPHPHPAASHDQTSLQRPIEHSEAAVTIIGHNDRIFAQHSPQGRQEGEERQAAQDPPSSRPQLTSQPQLQLQTSPHLNPQG